MSKRNDISQQIRRYLNGELDARAMHQLEKEAQNDPFLMEALEGYEKAGADQHNNLDELYTRLEQRTAEKQARVIPFRVIAIAASILLFLGVGILWLANRNPYVPKVKLKKIALAAPPKEKASNDTLKQAVTAQRQTPNLIAQTEPKKHVSPVPAQINDQPYKAAESIPPVQPAANGYVAQDIAKNNADAKLSAIIQPSVSLKTDSLVAANKNSGLSHTSLLKGKVDGVDVKPAPSNNEYNRELAAAKLGLNKDTRQSVYNNPGARPDSFSSNELKGVVTDETGVPIPGATVKVKGTDIAVTTDAAGKFKINSLRDNTVLNIGFIGYTSKEIQATMHDSLVIAMQPNQAQLAEVVVTTAYGVKKKTPSHAALPRNGWAEFKKYLTENAISPDGKTGTVKLSFIVNTNNSLSDFKIIKSVSAKTDSAAIDLVNDGPNWQSNTNGKAEKVKLSIKFTVQ